MPASEAGVEIGEWLVDIFRRRRKEIEKRQMEDNTVSFIPNKNGGGKVTNSYMLTSWSDIYEYSCDIKQQYPDQFKGSAEGMAVEWAVHTVACYIPFLDLDRAKDVDFGYTIFYDSHTGMNLAMWGVYYVLSPEQYHADLEATILG